MDNEKLSRYNQCVDFVKERGVNEHMEGYMCCLQITNYILNKRTYLAAKTITLDNGDDRLEYPENHYGADISKHLEATKIINDYLDRLFCEGLIYDVSETIINQRQSVFILTVNEQTRMIYIL